MVKNDFSGADQRGPNDEVPRGQRRAANKAMRVSALLTAARALIVSRGSTEFTMQQLAEAAGLSLATTYNLIGTKAAVLYALLEAGLDKLSAAQSARTSCTDDTRLIAMARLAVEFLGSEPEYYRPLMRHLLGVYEPAKRPIFMARALAYWRIAVHHEHVDGSRTLPDMGSEDLAQGLHLAFVGALDLWVHAELDYGGFEQAILRQLKMLARL